MQHIFIGDVQGCADELEEILDRARSAFGDAFEAWIAGDLVNRGPLSRRALEVVRELVEAGRAHYILGNHEIALLSVWLGVREAKPTDTAVELLADRDADDWMDWLRRRPLACIGALYGEPFAMVHAAVHPDWSLADVGRIALAVGARLGADDRAVARDFLGSANAEAADRDALGILTRCRSIEEGREVVWSSSEPRGDAVAWHQAWLRRDHGYGVVYGHWALQGLHVERALRGLDTGCVHHGRPDDGALTAWVPARPAPGTSVFDVPDRSFWHVKARQPYYALVQKRVTEVSSSSS